jgi:hypothetical protein
MKMKRAKARSAFRAASKFVGLCALLAVTLVAWELLALRGEHPQVAEQGAAPAWGEEALATQADRGWPQSLIAPANACGLGASSCFQCHNGFRASAPSAERWHAQHDGVNHSCAGCHKGNARIMREEMAHRNMIADPRTQPAESCASCHREDLDQLVSSYGGEG